MKQLFVVRAGVLLAVSLLVVNYMVYPEEQVPVQVTKPTQPDFIKIPKENLTQSEAHMSVPVIRKTVESWYFLNKNKPLQDLWNAVVEREREFNDTHYFFYHGVSQGWRVVQDLFLRLYIKFHPLSVNVHQFRAFRWMPVGQISTKEWLKKEIAEYGLVNDNEVRLKAYLLSTNLSLFGNAGFPGECTMEYLLDAKSNTVVAAWAYESVLDLFGATRAYVPELMKLAETYLQSAQLKLYMRNAQTGKVGWQNRPAQTLCQICIPKEFVNDVAYVSWVQGIPFEGKLVEWIKGQTQHKVGANPRYAKTQAALADVRALFKDKQEGHPIFKSILQGIEQNKYNISTVLDEYKSEPLYLGAMINELQARLIVTPHLVGSVGAGVKVFDYDFVPPAEKASYEAALDAIVEKIFDERISRAVEKAEQQKGNKPQQTNNVVDVTQVKA